MINFIRKIKPLPILIGILQAVLFRSTVHQLTIIDVYLIALAFAGGALTTLILLKLNMQLLFRLREFMSKHIDDFGFFILGHFIGVALNWFVRNN